MKESAESLETENIEINLLLEAIYQKYHFDFREYAEASIRRRIKYVAEQHNYQSISSLTHDVLYKKEKFAILLKAFSINVSEMFRDPFVFKTIRTKVIPYLKTFPFIRIWIAGCSTGEELYSMAILLKEEGVYDKTQLYATDINPLVIDKAREGIFELNKLKTFTKNYHGSGGKEAFSDYFTADSSFVKFSDELKKNVMFSVHNLTVDRDFNEMHLIMCRNVMIYFSKPLQQKVYHLFNNCLHSNGFLCIGTKENLKFSEIDHLYNEIEHATRIYKHC